MTLKSGYDPKIHHRRSIRLKGYDYSLPGACFVTIVVRNRACLFGRCEKNRMRLNEVGCMVEGKRGKSSPGSGLNPIEPMCNLFYYFGRMPGIKTRPYQPVAKVVAAFDRPCIPADCVAIRAHTPGMRAHSALSGGRRNGLGARETFTTDCYILTLEDPNDELLIRAEEAYKDNTYRISNSALLINTNDSPQDIVEVA